MDNIQLIPTEELLKELLNRFDHAIFMGIKVYKEQGGEITSVRRWIGNSYTCCGLCESIKRSILNEFDSKEVPIGENDL